MTARSRLYKFQVRLNRFIETYNQCSVQATCGLNSLVVGLRDSYDDLTEDIEGDDYVIDVDLLEILEDILYIVERETARLNPGQAELLCPALLN